MRFLRDDGGALVCGYICDLEAVQIVLNSNSMLQPSSTHTLELVHSGSGSVLRFDVMIWSRGNYLIDDEYVYTNTYLIKQWCRKVDKLVTSFDCLSHPEHTSHERTLGTNRGKSNYPKQTLTHLALNLHWLDDALLIESVHIITRALVFDVR